MKRTGDFLDDFLQDEVEEFDGVVYNEETDAMFIDICKTICGLTEPEPMSLPSKQKESSTSDLESKIEASGRKLKEGYKKHSNGRQIKLLDIKDLPKKEPCNVRRKRSKVQLAK